MLDIPGSVTQRELRIGEQVLRQQGDDGIQAEQTGCRAGDGFIGPLPLRFDVQMSARFVEGDFHLPAGTKQSRIQADAACRSVHSRAWVSKCPCGSRTKTQRNGTLALAKAAMHASLRNVIKDVLDSLPPREAKVLRMRYGIDTGNDLTLEEVGKQFDVTRERIRQIESKAMNKLRHASRADRLKTFLEND